MIESSYQQVVISFFSEQSQCLFGFGFFGGLGWVERPPDGHLDGGNYVTNQKSVPILSMHRLDAESVKKLEFFSSKSFILPF